MKKQSISSHITVFLVFVVAIFILFLAAVVMLSNQISRATIQITHNEMPVALNSLAMLEELGDMNSNLLEYVLGERDEKQEYFANYDEFFFFYKQLPRNVVENSDIERVARSVSEQKTEVEETVFGIYDPLDEKRAAEKINNLIANVGGPLETLLDHMKDEEIADVNSSDGIANIINDDLPGVRYYLELVDEAGDMLADLDRFILGDANAQRAFFSDALQFETFLAELKPLEQRPQELVQIKEIERLFNELKSGGSDVFESYKASNKVDAMTAIDHLEHQRFKVSERILDALSTRSRNTVDESMTGLDTLAKRVSLILVVGTIIAVMLIAFVTLYTKRAILAPTKIITDAVVDLRSGGRSFEIATVKHNNELTAILDSLKLFQSELAELDNLRSREQQMQDEILRERDMAKSALQQLQNTQAQLIETEKMASLGKLVAGIAHEVNTPIGVSVTMSSTLSDSIEKLLNQLRQGELKLSTLDKFEASSSDALNLLDKSLQNAAQLIHSFKQVAVDQSSSNRRVFNLFSTINEIVSTLQHKIQSTNIHCYVEGDETIEMDSYPGSLGQVITNLFDNALLHGFDGLERGEIRIRISRVKDTVKILFTDNGRGVDEASIKSLFDPFFTTKLGKGGSGLGLNIVHNIVTQLMGGSIQVESHIGTVFEIKLPLMAPQISERSNDE